MLSLRIVLLCTPDSHGRERLIQRYNKWFADKSVSNTSSADKDCA